jgi:hypothetical protein
MKKLFLSLFIAVFAATVCVAFPTQDPQAYTLDDKDKKKKDPPGPPVVRDKDPKDKKDSKPKEPPKDSKKGKKPEGESD